jgi:hypothetical protein
MKLRTVDCGPREGFSESGYPIIPSVGVVKFARFGNTDGRSAAATPNHLASVAAYGSSEVVGTHLPELILPGERIGEKTLLDDANVGICCRCRVS